MSRVDGTVLLVGSVPGDNALDAMSFCARELGDRLSLLPDGETGFRKIWINYLAATVYSKNPALETVNQPEPINAGDPAEWRQPEDYWVPKGYHDHWQFKRVPGRAIEFETLGYAREAAASYEIFKDLRAEGLISEHQRFMVAMPMCESAVRPFLGKSGEADYPAMTAAYTEAMSREIPAMLEAIPAPDLAIQWDVCIELLAIAVNDQHSELFPWVPASRALDRYLETVQTFAGFVPPDIAMGLHLCYGDLGHRHFIEPQDLAVATRVAVETRNAIDRPIDFCHVPVPRNRADDAYFEPLSSWPDDAGRLFLGLVHHTDGVPGTRRRMETAQRHVRQFGIATECGFGRRHRETLPELMRIHREIADLL